MLAFVHAVINAIALKRANKYVDTTGRRTAVNVKQNVRTLVLLAKESAHVKMMTVVAANSLVLILCVEKMVRPIITVVKLSVSGLPFFARKRVHVQNAFALNISVLFVEQIKKHIATVALLGVMILTLIAKGVVHVEEKCANVGEEGNEEVARANLESANAGEEGSEDFAHANLKYQYSEYSVVQILSARECFPKAFCQTQRQLTYEGISANLYFFIYTIAELF